MPHGEAKYWQRPMPAKGSELKGWRVLVLCLYKGQPTWYEGIIVDCSTPRTGKFAGNELYTVYYQAEDVHEEFTLPDLDLVFRHHTFEPKVAVSQDMLP